MSDAESFFAKTSIVGCDVDSEFIEKLKVQFQKVKNVQFFVRDLLTDNAQCLLPRPLWVICNPPYGERLKLQGATGDKSNDFTKILDSIEKNYQPNLIGVLVPRHLVPRIKKPKKWCFVDELQFKHGGLPMSFCVWQQI